MRIAVLRPLAVAVVLLGLCRLPAQAQETSPIDDLIVRVMADLNDLRYADAIRRGYEVFAFAGRTMRPEQEVRLRSTMAAAFYPEEAESQRPDSALAQFDAVIRLAPDATLPVEIRWAGLDSLLEVSRRRTFAVVVRPAADQELAGPTGRGHIEFVASRPVRARLRSVAGGRTMVQDTLAAPARSGRLAFRALDGRTVTLPPGTAEFVLVVSDPTSRDSVVARRTATVEGAALTLVPAPTLDSTRLKPETSKPRRVRTALTGILFATATSIIATSGRGEEPVRSAFNADGRATLITLGILGATVGTYWLDKGVPDPAAIAANAQVRTAHRTAVDAADTENRKRLESFKVMVKFQPETR